MDRLYRGLRENGIWDDFESNSRSAAEPQNSGYEKVVDAATGEEILNTPDSD